MLQTEYLRSLHCNYERILLNQELEAKKYQYCILMRGEVKGLLACNLRYINGTAYLYYDISSKQNIARLFAKRNVNRDWMREFLWSFKQMQIEMKEYLLDEKNILWDPEHIYQDIDNNAILFLYIPYYEGTDEGSFNKLLDFWVEHIDYDDEVLVDFVYRVYEEYEQNGDLYLRDRIFSDAKILEEQGSENSVETDSFNRNPDGRRMLQEVEVMDENGRWKVQEEKKGFLGRYMQKRRKMREEKGDYRRTLEITMESEEGYVVAESSFYGAVDRRIDEEEADEAGDKALEISPRIFTKDGKLLGKLEQDRFIIGKRSDEVDLVLEDASVSRMHAGIVKENGGVYLEDLNSQNGTFLNGVRMQPYERRRLDEGDEIRCAKVELIYR